MYKRITKSLSDFETNKWKVDSSFLLLQLILAALFTFFSLILFFPSTFDVDIPRFYLY